MLRPSRPSATIVAMSASSNQPSIIKAAGEEPAFKVGDAVTVAVRYPVGHYRVPMYVRGKRGVIEAIIEPSAINNEEEAFGRNAGSRLHYYRVAFPLKEIWSDYAGAPVDGLRIEIFETWLERT
jgi:nitrile hydratase